MGRDERREGRGYHLSVAKNKGFINRKLSVDSDIKLVVLFNFLYSLLRYLLPVYHVMMLCAHPKYMSILVLCTQTV